MQRMPVENGSLSADGKSRGVEDTRVRWAACDGKQGWDYGWGWRVVERRDEADRFEIKRSCMASRLEDGVVLALTALSTMLLSLPFV